MFQGANFVLKICKIPKCPHVEHCTQAWAPVSRHGNWRVVLSLERIQRRVTKIIKKEKDYSYRERLEKLGLTTLLERRLRGELVESLEIINGISNYDWHFFNISIELEIYGQGRFEKINLRIN